MIKVGCIKFGSHLSPNIESIIFPIPVDPFLAALTLAIPKKAFKFAIYCTIGSVIGGIFGWLLGYLIGPSIETLMLNIPWFTEEKFNAVKFWVNCLRFRS